MLLKTQLRKPVQLFYSFVIFQCVRIVVAKSSRKDKLGVLGVEKDLVLMFKI